MAFSRALAVVGRRIGEGCGGRGGKLNRGAPIFCVVWGELGRAGEVVAEFVVDVRVREHL